MRKGKRDKIKKRLKEIDRNIKNKHRSPRIKSTHGAPAGMFLCSVKRGRKDWSWQPPKESK